MWRCPLEGGGVMRRCPLEEGCHVEVSLGEGMSCRVVLGVGVM